MDEAIAVARTLRDDTTRGGSEAEEEGGKQDIKTLPSFSFAR